MAQKLEMTEQQQRIAIAEACGWESSAPDWGGERHNCPDYLNDLNAMHEAEKVLTRPQFEDYICELSFLTSNNKTSSPYKWTVVATAAQRAEAFLKTLNLWQ